MRAVAVDEVAALGVGGDVSDFFHSESKCKFFVDLYTLKSSSVFFAFHCIMNMYLF